MILLATVLAATTKFGRFCFNHLVTLLGCNFKMNFVIFLVFKNKIMNVLLTCCGMNKQLIHVLVWSVDDTYADLYGNYQAHIEMFYQLKDFFIVKDLQKIIRIILYLSFWR